MKAINYIHPSEALKLHSENKLILMHGSYQYQHRFNYRNLKPRTREILLLKCRQIQAELHGRTHIPVAA